MAAVPGVLAWVWEIVGPAYRSGEVARAAATLRNAAMSVSLEPFPDDELSRAGLDETGRQALTDLLEAYNRGNTQNLIGWLALLGSLREDGNVRQEAPSGDRPDRPELRPLPPLPPLPRLDNLDAATSAAVMRLSARHDGFPAGAVPSLYLHLAVWPGLLEPVDGRLRRTFEAGRLAKAASRLDAIARAEACRLAPGLPNTVAPPSDTARTEIETTLKTLTSSAVQEMILVGTALARALHGE
jgi:hypothetical protein